MCVFLHFDEDSHKQVELNEKQYGPVSIKATPASKTFHQDISGPASRNSGGLFLWTVFVYSTETLVTTLGCDFGSSSNY